jgi:hypothetical protein
MIAGFVAGVTPVMHWPIAGSYCFGLVHLAQVTNGDVLLAQLTAAWTRTA